MDDRSEAVPLQEPQFAVRRLEGSGTRVRHYCKGPGALRTRCRLASQRLHVEVAKLYPAIVTLQSQVSLLTLQTGLLLQMILVIIEIGIDDLRAVQFDRDVTALGSDAVLVPFADGLGHVFRRRHDAID